MVKSNSSNLKGFTLIELLVVIAIIATLAVLVYVALDPVRRFQESRNSRRWTDVNSLLTAVHQYIVDNEGTMPAGMTSNDAVYQLGTCNSGATTICAGATEAACLDVSTPLATYLKSMPIDPQTGSAATTGYSVSVDTNNLVTIAACSAERGEVVQVSR